MDATMLRTDCAQCAALCCVALAFDRSHLFAIDKAAGEPCPNLSPRGRCAIHARREQMGFGGCAMFDCLGAGQRVTSLFAHQSWRDDAATANAMFDAFRAMRRVHELMQLLNEAGKLALTPAQAATRCMLLDSLDADAATSASLAAFERSGRSREVSAFLRSLR